MKNLVPSANSLLGRLIRDKRVMTLVAGLAMGATLYALGRHVAHTPQPWLARARVQRFLAKKGISRSFKVEFAFPSKVEMAKAPQRSAAGSPKIKPEDEEFEALRTQYFSLKSAVLRLGRQVDQRQAEFKACEAQWEAVSRQLAEPGATKAVGAQAHAATLRDRKTELQRLAGVAQSELQAKETALAPVATELQAMQARWVAEAEADGSASARQVARAGSLFAADLRPQFAQAFSYGQIYRLIGQELGVAHQLLASANPGHQRVGVTLALDAGRHALEDAQDGWLAARICEGYVWPHLGLASDTTPDSRFNLDNLLAECADIFLQHLEVQLVARTCEKMMARPGSTSRLDRVRSQVAMVCEERGDLKLAVQWWRQVQNTNDYRWVLRRLPALEKRLARQ